MTPQQHNLILSIETATPHISVALHRHGTLQQQIKRHSPRLRSDTLQSMIETLFAQTGQHQKDLTAIAISHGPGSYTGLRMGTALAKGLSYGHHIPLLAIPTLHTLMQGSTNTHPNTIRCGLLDASRGYAYAIIMQGRTLLKDTHTCQVTAATFAKLASNHTIHFLGSGAERYTHELRELPNSHILQGHYPEAQHIGTQAYKKWQAGQTTPQATYTPHYLNALHVKPQPPTHPHPHPHPPPHRDTPCVAAAQATNPPYGRAYPGYREAS